MQTRDAEEQAQAGDLGDLQMRGVVSDDVASLPGMRFPRFVLGVMGLAFAVVAALGWFAPPLLLAPLGVDFSEAAGLAEVRAAYGGLFGASSVLFLRGAVRPQHAEIALRWAVLVLCGFVFGRLASLALDGLPAWPAWAALVSECNGLIASLVALRRITKEPPPRS